MTGGSTRRSRTIEWEPVGLSTHDSASIGGLDYLRAVKDGQIPAPPILSLIDFSMAEVEEGRCVYTLVPAEYHYNTIGTVHGGIAATLLDSAMGSAIHSTLPAGFGHSTIDLCTKHVRAITIDSGEIHCEGRVLHRGRSTATAEGRLYDRDGRLCAHGTTTCLIFPATGR